MVLSGDGEQSPRRRRNEGISQQRHPTAQSGPLPVRSVTTMMNSQCWFRIPRVGSAAVAILVALTAGLAVAATPPPRVNYQGVIRDPASGLTLSGAYDAIFRFYSAATGGDEVLVDTHMAAANQGLSVTNGLFSVPLGGGAVTDGSGPGTYA